MDLVAFLTARLDEDEAAAKAAQNADEQHERGMPEAAMREAIDLAGRRERVYDSPWWAANMKYWLDRRAWGWPNDPARALREVEAKRRILAAYESAERDRIAYGDAEPEWHIMRRTAFLHACELLAAVYSDYDPAWKLDG